MLGAHEVQALPDVVQAVWPPGLRRHGHIAHVGLPEHADDNLKLTAESTNPFCILEPQ